MGNSGQFLAIIGNACKLLILRGRLVRDQEAGGSNPLAPTNLFLVVSLVPGVEAFAESGRVFVFVPGILPTLTTSPVSPYLYAAVSWLPPESLR